MLRPDYSHPSAAMRMASKTSVTVVPEDELWLHQPKAREDLQRALDWAQGHPPRESDPDAILKGLGDGGGTKRKKRSA